jgi:RNA polymerase sigma-70 factor (ECF subfamily)
MVVLGKEVVAAVGGPEWQGFDAFVTRVEPVLRRALLGAVGIDRLNDAVGEALAYAWEHWDRISAMDQPAGYLFRVGQSKTRLRKPPRLPPLANAELPEVEPGLPTALMALPDRQRAAVWLTYGCGWSHAETGEALGITPSTVATHASRGLDRLRSELGVVTDA